MKKRILMVSLICILLVALALPVLMAPDNPLPAAPPAVAVAEAEAVTPPTLAIVQQDEGPLAAMANDNTGAAYLMVASLVVLASMIALQQVRKRWTKLTANLQSRVWGFSASAGIV